MKNPFKNSGFDTLISKGTNVKGDLELSNESTTVIDGMIKGETLTMDSAVSAQNCTLFVNGSAFVKYQIDVQNITVTGILECDTLLVAGVLAVKNGASIQARIIKYGSLVVEPKAKIFGMLSPFGEDVEKEKTGTARTAFDVPELVIPPQDA